MAYKKTEETNMEKLFKVYGEKQKSTPLVMLDVKTMRNSLNYSIVSTQDLTASPAWNSPQQQSSFSCRSLTIHVTIDGDFPLHTPHQLIEISANMYDQGRHFSRWSNVQQ